LVLLILRRVADGFITISFILYHNPPLFARIAGEIAAGITNFYVPLFKKAPAAIPTFRCLFIVLSLLNAV